jgi:hypothetical protein
MMGWHFSTDMGAVLKETGGKDKDKSALESLSTVAAPRDENDPGSYDSSAIENFIMDMFAAVCTGKVACKKALAILKLGNETDYPGYRNIICDAAWYFGTQVITIMQAQTPHIIIIFRCRSLREGLSNAYNTTMTRLIWKALLHFCQSVCSLSFLRTRLAFAGIH